jgi:TonB family protein
MRASLIFTVGVTIVTSYVAVPKATAQQSAVDRAAGVNAQGVRRSWTPNSPESAAFRRDVVKHVFPEYSFEARKARQEGSGLFRLRVDLATGKITKATVLKSTGFARLDNSALSAFRRWQMKPGRWRELDVPVTFSLSPPISVAPAGTRAGGQK